MKSFDKFDFKPFLHGDDWAHEEELLEIQAKLHEQLKDFPNFLGVDFCDVSAGGIQIRGHHKQIQKYTYPITNQTTLLYDLSNKDEAIDEFVEYWKLYDNPKDISDTKDFILAGERYGWD